MSTSTMAVKYCLMIQMNHVNNCKKRVLEKEIQEKKIKNGRERLRQEIRIRNKKLLKECYKKNFFLNISKTKFIAHTHRANRREFVSTWQRFYFTCTMHTHNIQTQQAHTYTQGWSDFTYSPHLHFLLQPEVKGETNVSQTDGSRYINAVKPYL